jgi:hypothetical protein
MSEINHPLKIELRKRACRRINNTSLPQLADREGWLHGLIDFVVKHDRMPDKDEQAELKRVADGIEANLKALALLKPLPKAKGWGTLGGMGSVEGLRAFRKIMKLRAHREIFGEPDYTRGLGLDLNRDREFFDTEAKAFAEAMDAAPDAI